MDQQNISEAVAEAPPAVPSRKPSLITTIALGLATALAAFSLLYPEDFMELTNAWNGAFMQAASDWVVIISSSLLFLCLAIAISPLGNIRLGLENETPEFSTHAWWAMLFAAGMGAGLLYWAVAEPIVHSANLPPYGPAMQAAGAERMGVVISYLHWALHPWGVYAAGALCIAFFSFCKGFSILPSAPFRAVLPKGHFSRAVGDVVDVLCVISLLLGLAASLSAGTMQIASGTGWLGHEHYDQFSTYFLLLVLLTLTYLLSASTGLHKGIKRLSELNMVLVILLALLVWATLSFTGVFATLWHGLTDYARFLPSLSFAPLESAEQPDWSAKWTANYFLSWIAWVPFVGIFVARISKGRTIREFLSGVVLVPSLFTFIWFAIFATASYDLQNTGVVDLAAAVKEDSGQALFALLSVFPGAEYLFMLVIALVFIFLVTSADSASFVLAMMAGQGIQNPSAFSKLFWGLTIAAMTGATLYSESGIHSVRAVFSFAGIAVFFILIGQMACLIWGLLGHSRTKRNDVEY